jgi:hypothetical protein
VAYPRLKAFTVRNQALFLVCSFFMGADLVAFLQKKDNFADKGLP